MQKSALQTFATLFPDDDACFAWLRDALYPERSACPSCKVASTFYRVTGRKVYACHTCGSQISPLVGTIFAGSSTALRSWFSALSLLASTRAGISAEQSERELGVTCKTAWRMARQIRTRMADAGGPLSGAVEVDETDIGGRRKGKRGRGAAGATIVAGAVERGGDAIMEVVPDVKARTLLPFMQANVPQSPDTAVYTDELLSYGRLGKAGYAHKTVHHGIGQFVNGLAYVDTGESLRSNTKRGRDGVNHAVSPRHLQAYLDADAFRYDHRRDAQPMSLPLLGRVSSARASGPRASSPPSSRGGGTRLR